MRAVALTQVAVTETRFDGKKALETITAVEKQLLNVALFLLAPFIGLVYAMALPFVGIGMFLVVGAKAFAARGLARQNGRRAQQLGGDGGGDD